MTFLLVAFIAGVLTVLAPCILPVLPIIIGGSVGGERSLRKPLVIIASLSVSVILFTFLLKVSTVFISVDPLFWKALSGGILIGFGFVMIFPGVWEWVSAKLGLGKSQKLVASGKKREGVIGDILVGAALGPVFSSCSPTYIAIIATILPASLIEGTVYLLAYVLGLALVLFLIAFYGQKFVSRINGLADPNGWFKKVLGILFILVGLAVLTGYDKIIESRILDTGVYDGITDLEAQITNFGQ